MKKSVVITALCLMTLALAGCSLMYGIIPSTDPIVGSWTVSQVSSGASAFQSASAAGWAGTMSVKADSTWSEDYTATPYGAMTMSGTWTDSSPGVYTIIVGTSTAPNYGSYVVTLSKDQKTMYSAGGGGVSLQLSKN
jgi:hypothetical protein